MLPILLKFEPSRDFLDPHNAMPININLACQLCWRKQSIKIQIHGLEGSPRAPICCVVLHICSMSLNQPGVISHPTSPFSLYGFLSHLISPVNRSDINKIKTEMGSLLFKSLGLVRSCWAEHVFMLTKAAVIWSKTVILWNITIKKNDSIWIYF